jgi:CubicO group peptidase (beta-lactamase class C family)
MAAIHRDVCGAFVLWAFLAWAGHAAPQRPDFGHVDAFIEAQLREANIPGAALAIVERDGIVHLRGFGSRGPGLGPVTPHTLFILGSVSKAITAMALMQLVAASRVELDAPVRRYLPWFTIVPEDEAPNMTVRHIMNHTSGLSTTDGWKHFASRDSSDTALEQLVRDLRQARLQTPPGEAFQYSNANYDIAAAIIQAVSGDSYEAYVQRQVFAPMQMRSSFTSAIKAREHGLARGHRYWFGRPIATHALPHPRSRIASGYLISSAADIGRFLVAHLNGGTVDNRQILSPAAIDTLHRPHGLGSAHQAYGMGWFVEERNDERNWPKVLWHEGSVPDYHAHMAIAPEAGWGFILLVNAESHLSGPHVSALGYEVVRLLAGRIPRPINKAAGIWTPGLALLAGLLSVQVLAALHTLCRSRPWNRNRQRRPWGWLQLVWHAVLPAITSLGLAMLLLVILPRVTGMPLSGLRLFLPDAGLLLIANATFACLWVLIRTILVARSAGALPT